MAMWNADRRSRLAGALLVVWSAAGLGSGLGVSDLARAQSLSPESSSSAAAESAILTPPPATPAELAAARALLARAVKATCLGKPSDLKSFSWSDSGQMFLEQAVFPARTKTVQIPGKCHWQEHLLPMGVTTLAYCGENGWVRSPAGKVRDLSAREWMHQRREREIDLVRVLLHASELEARPIPDTVLATGPAAGLAVFSDLVRDWRLWIDKKTGYIVRSDYLDPPLTGEGIVRHAWEYVDYITASDLLKWPAVRRKTVNGKLQLELGLQRAASNPEVPAALFDHP